MFNLQGSELIIILLLALVVLGPEKLPDAMRKMGQFYAELRKMSSGFQQEFQSVVDEPMREMRDTANLLRDSADFTKLQGGERDEKPKSAEMGVVDDAEPIDDVPLGDDVEPSPEPEPEASPQPFSGDEVSSAAPRPAAGPTAAPPPPAPFSGSQSLSVAPSDPAETPASMLASESDAPTASAAAPEDADDGQPDDEVADDVAGAGETRVDPDGDVGVEGHDR